MKEKHICTMISIEWKSVTLPDVILPIVECDAEGAPFTGSIEIASDKAYYKQLPAISQAVCALQLEHIYIPFFFLTPFLRRKYFSSSIIGRLFTFLYASMSSQSFRIVFSVFPCYFGYSGLTDHCFLRIEKMADGIMF